MWAYGTALLFEHRTLRVDPVAGVRRHQRPLLLARVVQGDGDRGKGTAGHHVLPLLVRGAHLAAVGPPERAGGKSDADDLGDAVAAVVGERIGQRRYTVARSTRSLEGSVVLFLISWAATLVPFMLLASEPLDAVAAVGAAAVAALGVVVIEALSPWRVDNLTVPAISALVLVLLLP